MTEPAHPSPAERAALASGVAYAALQIAAMLLFGALILPAGGPPDLPAAEKAARVLAHADTYRLGNFLMLLPVPFLIVFLGGLFAALRRAEGGPVLGIAAVAGGALVALVWPLAAVLHDVALEAARLGADPAVLAGFDAIAPYSLALSAVPRAVLVLAVAAAVRWHGLAPRALGTLGLIVALLGLVGTATLVNAALFPVLALSTLLFEVWMAALCLHLLRRPATRSAAPAAPLAAR